MGPCEEVSAGYHMHVPLVNSGARYNRVNELISFLKYDRASFSRLFPTGPCASSLVMGKYHNKNSG